MELSKIGRITIIAFLLFLVLALMGVQIIIYFVFFTIPALIGFGVIRWVTHKYSKITKVHYLCMLLPWFIWLGLMMLDNSGKSLGNIIELSILGGFVSLMLIIESIRIALNKFHMKYWPIATLTICCLFAVILWGYFPNLPE